MKNIRFETQSGSIYEINPILNRYRKGDGEWLECQSGYCPKSNDVSTYQQPVVGAFYVISLLDLGGHGKDWLTTPVKTIL